jgi:hypothetical protein
MSSPANTSFQLWKGDTLRFSLSLKTSGSAYNIPQTTSFAGAVKEKGTTTTYSLTASVTSASTGVVLFTLPATTSSNLSAAKNWIYDVQMTDSASIVTTLLYGNIFVTDEVTT